MASTAFPRPGIVFDRLRSVPDFVAVDADERGEDEYPACGCRLDAELAAYLAFVAVCRAD